MRLLSSIIARATLTVPVALAHRLAEAGKLLGRYARHLEQVVVDHCLRHELGVGQVGEDELGAGEAARGDPACRLLRACLDSDGREVGGEMRDEKFERRDTKGEIRKERYERRDIRGEI